MCSHDDALVNCLLFSQLTPGRERDRGREEGGTGEKEKEEERDRESGEERDRVNGLVGI